MMFNLILFTSFVTVYLQQGRVWGRI